MKLSTQLAQSVLASWLARDESEVASLLAKTVHVTHSSESSTATSLALQTCELLNRTIERVNCATDSSESPDVEIVIGTMGPCHLAARHVFVTWNEGGLTVSHSAAHGTQDAHLPAILLLLASCYTSAAAVNALLDYPFASPERDVHISAEQLLGTCARWAAEVVAFAADSVLAGAGAVANGFISGLRCFPTKGELWIADPKTVRDSILPRCPWFRAGDVDAAKASALALRAAPFFPNLTLRPWVGTASELRSKFDSRKIERLIVTVDSRRARRRLQSELPREVFDASTTGISEVVLHFNRARDGCACLACIYKEDVGERQHEQHVAQALGISLDAVRREFVTPADAIAIGLNYSGLDMNRIVGRAFDSLFRELCAMGNLRTAEDLQVLAPLPFISALAGAALALEMAQRLNSAASSADFNYWRLSPWHTPNVELQQRRSSDERCECCGSHAVREAMGILWDSPRVASVRDLV